MGAILFDDALMAATGPIPGALESLVARAKEGDAEAFDGIMEATQSRVVSTAWRLLGSRDLALDAAQDVFLRVFRSLRRFELERDFHAWLYAIVVNVCRDLARQARRRERTFTRLEEGEAEVPRRPHLVPLAESDLLLSERRARVRAALDALPRKQREALVLRDLEGLTSEEVALVLGTTAGTVRSRVSAARRKLRVHCDRVFAGAAENTP
ncbi:MAG: sigma-70 family RNA polymerase sigma factor [Thermoanaerobaculia bacterium]|nr:sigma-70 family RNA polymerase sigma factor [Thermoanaerobaculia bacterium]